LFSADRIHALLVEKLPACRARVLDDAGDGEHFSVEVATPPFVGRSLVQQHQLVYQALGEHMRRDIHALALKTYVPEAWPHGE
jgi:stress-induced morphogen